MTSLFGGIMAERFGGKGVVGVSMLLSGFVTGTTPYITHDSFWFLFASRFILGVFGVSMIRMIITYFNIDVITHGQIQIKYPICVIFQQVITNYYLFVCICR